MLNPQFYEAFNNALVRLRAMEFRFAEEADPTWQHVTPYLTDHSAFDAYMLLVEVRGKRILYSGDFRTTAVIFWAGHGSTYPGKDSSAFTLAPDLIRAGSQEDAELAEHWDFDLGGPLFDGKPNACIDVGNLVTTMEDNEGNRARIERKTHEILAIPAVPILLGGDDSTPIPFLTGFAGHGPIWLLQIDAHIDWRDEVGGERYGYSSPMRRASEMAHVAGIVQVGMRGVGSARRAEIRQRRPMAAVW